MFGSSRIVYYNNIRVYFFGLVVFFFNWIVGFLRFVIIFVYFVVLFIAVSMEGFVRNLLYVCVIWY